MLVKFQVLSAASMKIAVLVKQMFTCADSNTVLI
jgi:hypothetical protein